MVEQVDAGALKSSSLTGVRVRFPSLALFLGPYMLVIGSHALNQVEFVREPQDIDLVVTPFELLVLADSGDLRCRPTSDTHWVGHWRGLRIELSVAYSGSLLEHLLHVHSGETVRELHDLQVQDCKPNWLYALKLSHRFVPGPHFEKTRRDILWLRGRGFTIPDEDWAKKKAKETEARRKHPNLRQSKKAFFNPKTVPYKYDHDALHRAVAIREKPAYLDYLNPGSEVWCSRELWEAASHGVKLNGVTEEAMVLALERSQIPYNFEPPEEYSFYLALRGICTTVTSGWFREWAWEHFDEVLDYQKELPESYCVKFKRALSQGRIPAFGG